MSSHETMILLNSKSDHVGLRRATYDQNTYRLTLGRETCPEWILLCDLGMLEKIVQCVAEAMQEEREREPVPSHV